MTKESESTKDIVRKALVKAWNLGQIYWRQADSESVKQHRKADDTRSLFSQHIEETLLAIEQQSGTITAEYHQRALREAAEPLHADIRKLNADVSRLREALYSKEVLVKAAISAERERAATIADKWATSLQRDLGNGGPAAEIRAMGEKES